MLLSHNHTLNRKVTIKRIHKRQGHGITHMALINFGSNIRGNSRVGWLMIYKICFFDFWTLQRACNTNLLL